jgi:hypothetical protein
VGVSVDTDGPQVVKKFMKDFGINYTIVMADDEIQNAFAGRSRGTRRPSSSTATGGSGTRSSARSPPREFEKELLASSSRRRLEWRGAGDNPLTPAPLLV